MWRCAVLIVLVVATAVQHGAVPAGNPPPEATPTPEEANRSALDAENSNHGALDPEEANRAALDPEEANRSALDAALARAGANRNALEQALGEVEPENREGLEFLVRHLSESDARSVSAELLLENVREAYRGFEEAPWSRTVPDSIFLNYVLPHAVISEPRESWRASLRERCRPLVMNATTPSEAAVILNQQIFTRFGVRYSTERARADQGPSQTIVEGKASCTGLSILLVCACRSVGVPARLAGTPLWADSSGNHSWVEIWDQEWHFTGAAEPTGDRLDEAWFTAKAAEARAAERMHAIYAVCYAPTGIRFPLVWDETVEAPYAVNVTARYARFAEPVPEGFTRVVILAQAASEDRRVRAEVTIQDEQGNVVFQGETRDDTADLNDHESALLPIGRSYEASGRIGEAEARFSFRAEPGMEPILLTFQ